MNGWSVVIVNRFLFADFGNFGDRAYSVDYWESIGLDPKFLFLVVFCCIVDYCSVEDAHCS